MRMVMTGLCLALWSIVAALPARAEEGEQYRTVAGTFVAAPVPSPNFPETNDGFDLALNGRVLAHFDEYERVEVAAEVRDPDEGPLALDRILLLEFLTGGTLCPASWRVAEFYPDDTALLSVEFNQCLDGTPTIEQHADGSVAITLDYAPDIAPDAYLYRNGTFRHAPTTAVARDTFVTAAGPVETAARTEADGGHPIELVLNGHTIAEGDGRWVKIEAALPDEKQPRLLLLAFRLSPEACYARWMVLEVAPDRPPQATPTFGDCRWPPEIVQLNGGGLLLYFSDAFPFDPDTYLYADGQLRPFNRERAP